MSLVAEPLNPFLGFQKMSVGDVFDTGTIPDSAALSSDVPLTGEMTSLQRKVKKFVFFKTVTVYYFPRMQGFSSIPSQDGPALGMSYRHNFVETYNLADEPERPNHDNYPSVEISQSVSLSRWPDNVLALNGLPSEKNDIFNRLEWISRIHMEAKEEKVLDSMLKPVSQRQRRKLLREAGVMKIDTVEVSEVRNIKLSRTLCGCLCKVVCHPDTCPCSQSEIPCQVDGGSFPCSCSAVGCGNASGRIQFDLSQVRMQRMMRLSQLEMEGDTVAKDMSMDIVNLQFVISPTKQLKVSKAKQNQGSTVGKRRVCRKPSERDRNKLRLKEAEKREHLNEIVNKMDEVCNLDANFATNARLEIDSFVFNENSACSNVLVKESLIDIHEADPFQERGESTALKSWTTSSSPREVDLPLEEVGVHSADSRRAVTLDIEDSMHSDDICHAVTPNVKDDFDPWRIYDLYTRCANVDALNVRSHLESGDHLICQSGDCIALETKAKDLKNDCLMRNGRVRCQSRYHLDLDSKRLHPCDFKQMSFKKQHYLGLPSSVPLDDLEPSSVPLDDDLEPNSSDDLVIKSYTETLSEPLELGLCPGSSVSKIDTKIDTVEKQMTLFSMEVTKAS